LSAQAAPGITEPLYLRVQSSCLFSESFWSTDCDCALQLSEALRLISLRGGLLLYLYEEGRGAGLNVKIEAIRLQQKFAMDTRSAYECLNVEPEQRTDYSAVGEVVRRLYPPFQPLCLLTNSPAKEQAVRRSGVNIVQVERLVCGTESEARLSYLREKQAVLGHTIFDD
jgi:GTP cyclohydrolase II